VAVAERPRVGDLSGMRSRPLHVALALASAVLAACSATPAATAPAPRAASDTTPPPITREMRGLWIATVGNIDWPSRPTLTPDQQRAELADILDRAQATGFNAVILQVRPAGDALYSSSLEPWAAWLTGTQGTDPGYDPLAFAVSEAHARGLELHAWINPFRAGNAADSARLAPGHFFNAHRDLSRVYGTQLWFDPAESAVQDHVMRVVSDIVQRYDVDAVHLDDYFYPYPQNDSAGKAIDFPDSASYVRSGSSIPRADWRRENVDRFVARLYREVHQLKPTVKVGISPFGIWRPGNPASVAGLDAYAAIYADSRKWLQQGWVDYLAPQLYWAIGAPQQSYPALLDWWLGQSTMGRHVWPGLAAYRVQNGTPSAFGASEIYDQIRLTRARPAGTGHILYNTTYTLKRNGGAIAAGLAPLYESRAIVPASPWLDGAAPPTPSLAVAGRTVTITPATGEPVRWWLVRSRVGGLWSTRLLFGDQRSLPLAGEPERVLVNAIDRAGNASGDVEWRERR
jgi:uncharacterized lipoprotein YddW (UPF0748 family)